MLFMWQRIWSWRTIAAILLLLLLLLLLLQCNYGLDTASRFTDTLLIGNRYTDMLLIRYAAA